MDLPRDRALPRARHASRAAARSARSARCSREHLDEHYAFYGECTGVRTARKHIGWYVAALPGGEPFRAPHEHARRLRRAARARSTGSSPGSGDDDASLPLRDDRPMREAGLNTADRHEPCTTIETCVRTSLEKYLQRPRRRVGARRLRDGDAHRREAGARSRDAARRRQPVAGRRRSSASTATRCARSSASTACCSAVASLAERRARRPCCIPALDAPVAPTDRSPTMIRRALLSVSDKTGLVDFATRLVELGVELLSTGGTAKLLADAGLPVIEVADYTGFPEMLDGRVKTLHPKVHGGILARRDVAGPHRGARQARHPARSTCWSSTCIRSRRPSPTPSCTLEDAIENIDIGGPAMVRSAAKNWQHVAVVTDPSEYAAVLDELRRGRRRGRDATRFALAAPRSSASRATTARSATTCRRRPRARRGSRASAFPSTLQPGVRQAAGPALRREPAPGGRVLPRPASARRRAGRAREQLQGKELSYNNIADADAAWECVKTFDAPACVIVKHANPCGVAVGARRARRVREGVRRPIRRRRSAASSRSTSRSTRRRPRGWSASSSSKC